MEANRPERRSQDFELVRLGLQVYAVRKVSPENRKLGCIGCFVLNGLDASAGPIKMDQLQYSGPCKAHPDGLSKDIGYGKRIDDHLLYDLPDMKG